MRCYRIDEQAIVGVHLTTTPDGLCIEVGDKQVPIDKSLEQSFIAAKNEVVERLRECQISRRYAGAELTDKELEEIEDMAEMIETEPISVVYADVDGKKVVQQRRKRGKQTSYLDALVLVDTAPGPNGTVSFKSATYDEYIDTRSGRVKRRYRDTFPPPGVHIVEEGKTAQGGKCLLLRMMPSSSFRIERTGELDGEPNVLTVVWKGQKGAGGELPLLVFSPMKHREQQ